MQEDAMKQRIFQIFFLSACLTLVLRPSAPAALGPEQAAALERKIDLINGLMSQRRLAARIFDDLNTALPDRVWMTEVHYDSKGIQIKGSARTNILLSDYVLSLEGNPNLTSVTLQSSIQRRARNNEYQEFVLRALVKDTRAGRPSALSRSGSDSAALAALATRLKELEKVMPARKETAEILRQVQQIASDSQLKVMKFAPGSEIQKEFYGEFPIAIEVTGTRQDLRRFFGRMADLPRLWLISEFSIKAISNQDADSPIRASITAQTYFLRETPATGARL